MNKYLIEFLGTTFFAFVVFTTNNYLAIGATLALMIWISNQLSGLSSHNPAITIGMYYGNKLTKKDFIIFILVEIAAALAGFELAKMALNRHV
jgi:glycerol uptake facilitator-like aquaporin